MPTRSEQQQRLDAYMDTPEWSRVVAAMFTDAPTVEDALTFIRVELEDALNNIPPSDKNGPIDTWHAGCAALRAYSVVLRVSKLLASERSAVGVE